MNVSATAIEAVKLIVPTKHGDGRGFFSETYNKRALAEAGVSLDFVQDNHSLSAQKGTVRGLHFQVPPFAQDKLVRVVRGAVLDVAVDLRAASPSFGQNVCIELSAGQWNQLLVPAGFAHGFCTLEPDTEVIYKVTNFYSPRHDRGIIWNDADLAVVWPVEEGEALLSERDAKLPRFAAVKDDLPF